VLIGDGHGPFAFQLVPLVDAPEGNTCHP
jgi:hypothetical protein